MTLKKMENAMEKKRIIPTLHYNGDDKTCPAVLVVDMCSYV